LLLDQVTLNNVPVAVGNYGFENPALGTGKNRSYLYNPPVVAGTQDWSFIGTAGVTGNNSTFTTGNPSSPEGAQTAFLQSSGCTISQSLLFPSSSNYTLLFYAAQRASHNRGAQSANVYLDGVLMGTISPSSSAYQVFKISITATQGKHLLKFQGMANTDSTLMLDQVTFTSP